MSFRLHCISCFETTKKQPPVNARLTQELPGTLLFLFDLAVPVHLMQHLLDFLHKIIDVGELPVDRSDLSVRVIFFIAYTVSSLPSVARKRMRPCTYP